MIINMNTTMFLILIIVAVFIIVVLATFFFLLRVFIVPPIQYLDIEETSGGMLSSLAGLDFSDHDITVQRFN